MVVKHYDGESQQWFPLAGGGSGGAVTVGGGCSVKVAVVGTVTCSGNGTL